MAQFVLIQVPNFLEKESVNSEILIPVSMAWLQFLVAFFSVLIFSRMMQFTRATTGALVLTAGLGNTSFVGFPLLEALLGADSLRIAVIVDQAGSFLVLSTLGLLTASLFSDKTTSYKEVTLRILRFPPFIALLASVGLYFYAPLSLQWLRVGLEILSATLVPLALVSVGFQLIVSREVLARRRVPLVAGLSLKLMMIPAVMAIFYMRLFGEQGEIVQVTILESAMAPMITAAIVAADFDLDTEIANLMVGVGIPVSLLTVTAWNWFLF